MNATKPNMLVPQAIYTDPMSKGQASGYYLVASSPSLQTKYKTILQAHSGLTDALQTEVIPRTYWSFFALELPNEININNYILTQRFAFAGPRRNANRMVVHSIILSKEILDYFQWDVEGIRNNYKFTANDYSGTLTQWQEIVGQREVYNLPDLTITDFLDTNQLTAQQEFCRKQIQLRTEYGWTWSQLKTAFLGTCSALEYNKKIALAQDIIHETFLLLTWAALPPTDRSTTFWTTYLPTDATFFCLSNTLNTSIMRSNPDYVLWENLPQWAEKTSPAMQLLATWYIPEDLTKLEQPDHWQDLHQLQTDLQQYNLSLWREPERIQAWTQFFANKATLVEFFAVGSDNLDKLKTVLLQLRASGLKLLPYNKAPWLEANSIIQGLCLTGLKYLKNLPWDSTKTSLQEISAIISLHTIKMLLPIKAITELLEQANDTQTLTIALLAIAFNHTDTTSQANLSNHNQASLLDLLSHKNLLPEYTEIKNSYPNLLQFVLLELAFGILNNNNNNEDNSTKAAMQIIQNIVQQNHNILEELVIRIIKIPNQSDNILHLLWVLAVELNTKQLIEKLINGYLLDKLSNHPKAVVDFPELTAQLQSCSGAILLSCIRKWHEQALREAATALRYRLEFLDPGIVTQPENLLAILSKAWTSGSTQEWAAPILKLFNYWRKNSQTHANSLLEEWWRLLALPATRATWPYIPVESLHMVPEMTEYQARKLLDLWKPQITSLDEQPGEEELVAVLFNIANQPSYDQKFISKLEQDYYNGYLQRYPENLPIVLRNIEYRMRRRSQQLQPNELSNTIVTLINNSQTDAHTLLNLWLNPKSITLYILLFSPPVMDKLGEKLLPILINALENNTLPIAKASIFIKAIATYVSGNKKYSKEHNQLLELLATSTEYESIEILNGTIQPAK